MKRLFLFVLILFVNDTLNGQTPVPSESFDFYLELISELRSGEDEGSDINDLAYELYDLWESPININAAGPYELGRLFWLTEFQLNNLIRYLQKQKPVLSIYELVYIPGFDSTVVVSLEPFITVVNAEHNGAAFKNSRHWLMLRAGRIVEAQKGFREQSLEGSAWKENFRYKYQYGEKIFAGFSLEKDAGESTFRGSNKAGPDFYSGYLKISNLGIIKNITAGNFSTGFGQGLVAGPGFAMGKTTAVNPVQKESGIRPYTSNDENRYFQGIASTLTFQPVDVSFFFSLKNIDANVTRRNTKGEIVRVSSLQNTGIHSTPAEMADENALREVTAGGRVLIRKTNFQAGLTFIHSAFNAEIVPLPGNYNQFFFRGREQTNAGADYKFNFRNTTLFGEETIDLQGDPAFLNGIISDVGGRMQFSLLHRYYSRGYHTFYGKAFGESSRVQNEEGVYGGIRLSVIQNINLAMFADFFRFPWLTSAAGAPSRGRELMVQAEYIPSVSFSAWLQYRTRQKQIQSGDSTDTGKGLVVSESDRLRIHLNYKASDKIILSSRLELGNYGVQKKTKDRSYLLYQDVRFNFLKPRVQLSLRYALFNSDSYDSRIYAYENDVPFSFSVNVYDNQGLRYYAMVKFSPFGKLDFWIRFSQTVYPHEKSISTGLWQIEGNKKSDVRMQVVWKF